jgi:hypothetical protein
MHVAKLTNFRIKLFIAFFAATCQPSCSRNIEAPHRLATNWTVNYGFVARVTLPSANLLVPNFNHVLRTRPPGPYIVVYGNALVKVELHSAENANLNWLHFSQRFPPS